MSEEKLEDVLKTEKIIIYGAHLVALEYGKWLIQNGMKDKLVGFAVTEMDINPDKLLGLPVKKIDEYANYNYDLTVIIATPEKYHSVIEKYAKEKGFHIFLKIGLEDMSNLKAKNLLLKQKNYLQFTFTLKEDENDPSWLNMVEKTCQNNSDNFKVENMRHYKFPTLFYLDEEKILDEAMSFDFYKDYEKTCGYYQNLHMQPIEKKTRKSMEELKKIIKIYMAFSNWDSAKTDVMQYDPWIYPLQLGSKISGRKNGNLFDDMGDSISEYNNIFAEMTGSYWIWKNGTSSKYKGLCHYRRHFIISEKEILALEQNKIDVILTTPRYVPGGIKRMFLNETPVKEKVYENMLRAISEIHVDDRRKFEGYMDESLYYPNNMVVAKNEIYDRYCEWIFPILFRMQEIDAEIGYIHTNDRHIAYASELLTSYYFVKNKEKYRIVVTDYKFIS